MNRARSASIAFATVAAVGSLLLAGDPPKTAGDSQSHLQEVPLVTSTPLASGENPRRIEADARETADYKLRVERIWRDGDKTHALVTIENRAKFAFGDLKLSCAAEGPAGQQVGLQERDLNGERDGAMPPGSITKVTFSFDTPKAEVRSLSCNALVF